MKKITLLMMAVILGLVAIAQNAETAPREKNRHRDHKNKTFKGKGSLENLNLSSKQRDEIKIINDNFKQQMGDLHSQVNLSDAERKQRRETLKKEHKERLASVLSPEQRKTATTAMELKGRKGSQKGGRSFELSKDLNLSQEQSERMSTINSTFKSNLQNIKQNTSLTKEQKREEMKNLMKKHRSDMETLLTNEQKEKLKTKQKNRPNRTAVK